VAGRAFFFENLLTLGGKILVNGAELQGLDRTDPLVFFLKACLENGFGRGVSSGGRVSRRGARGLAPADPDKHSQEKAGKQDQGSRFFHIILLLCLVRFPGPVVPKDRAYLSREQVHNPTNPFPQKAIQNPT
jgi:hypothetical protein